MTHFFPYCFRHIRLSLLSIVILLLLHTVNLSAADWPHWRGPHADGISRETGILKSWPKNGLKEIWRQPLGYGYSSIVLAGTMLYTNYGDDSNEYCAAFHQKTGELIWKQKLGTLFTNSFGSGPRATPAVDGNRVYAIGGNGDLKCFNAQTGKVIWHHNILKKFNAKNIKWGVSGSPFIYKDKLFYNTGGRENNSLVAFNKLTGKVIWTSGNDKAGYSTPIVANFENKLQVVFFTARGVKSTDISTGKILWEYDWKTNYDVNAATLIFKDDYLYLSSGYSSGAALLQISKSGKKYEAKNIWKSKKMKNHFSSSILWKKHLYGFNNEILTCMEFKTGNVIWTQRGFNKGSLIGIDGHMFILGERGQLGLAELTPDKYVEKARYVLFPDKKCWSVPIIVNGRAYIRNEEEIVCLDLKE